MRVIAVEIDGSVIERLRAERDPHAEVKAQAHALRAAYREAPEGFMHVAGSVRAVRLQ